VPELPSGRTLAKDLFQLPWVQRHNLLAAREGGALPDLTFYRDGHQVVARWFPDPEVEDGARPVRFFTAGESRLSSKDAEQVFQQLVEEVLTRLDVAKDEDTARLRDNWRALCQSRQREPDLCAWAAQLGIDPYDPSGITDELIDIFESKVRPLGEDLRADLLQASTANSLSADLDWLSSALQKAEVEQTSAPPASPISSASSNGPRSAHDFGYQQAEWFRKTIGLPAQPVSDLAEVLHAKCGWPKEPAIIWGAQTGNRLAALVAKDRHQLPHMVGPSCQPDNQRFRLARAVYFVPFASTPTPPRLLTGAYAWDQRASRAFAAELLAPATALSEEVHEGVAQAKMEELARKFNVSSWVIEHQLKNHRIGWTEEF
jgi:BMFP domain-containing protein YqiC